MKSPLLLAALLLAGAIPAVRADAAAIAAPRGTFQSIRFTLVNDNPFLNLIPPLGRDDDFGPTQATELDYTVFRTSGYLSDNERWSLQLRSDLYTRNLTPAGQNLFPHIPQAFNEVSTLNLVWDNLFDALPGNGVYHVGALGVGLVNDSRNIGFLALGQQTAWHHFKHYRLTPKSTALYDNKPGTAHDYFGTARIGWGRAISIGNAIRDPGRETDILKIEGGADLIGIRKGSSIYLLAAANRTVWRSGRTGIGVDAGARGNLIQTGDANIRSWLAFSLIRPSYTVQTGMSYVLGTQNGRLLKYLDHDPIWHMTVEKRWGG